jgi:dTDP-4-dehydrorhamnose reductase
MNGPLLVVGGDGLVGRALLADCRLHNEITLATVLTEPAVPGASVHFDLLCDPWPVLPSCRAAVLCAAIANQEACRLDPAATRDLNVVRTLRLAQQLLSAGTFVVFLSTNMVFDGSRPRRRADESVSPKTEYGRQKAEAEAGLLKLGERCAVVRLAKVFYRDLALIKTWREKLNAKQPIRAFSDYVCSPVPLSCVTQIIRSVAGSEKSGIWQVSATEDVSYADIALQVAKHSGADTALVRAAPAPPGSVEHLPHFTTMDASRVEEELQLRIPSAAETLERELRA